LDIRSLAIDPVNTQTIYAGTNNGVFKSTDGGTNWIKSVLTNTYVFSLVIDPTNTQVIYAGTRGGSIIKSIDSGTNWIEMNTGIINTSVKLLAINPKNTNIVYAVTDSSIFKSTNGGSLWSNTNFTIPHIESLYIKSFAIDPTNINTIYAGTGYGVFKTIQLQSYIIKSTISLGGSISPSGTITVNSGDSKTFTVTPNPGYKISLLKVDGASKGSISSYTFVNITSNHTIEVIFEKIVAPPSQTVIILQIGKSTFTVNGSIRTLDSPPVIKNSRTLLPIRAVVEALSGTIYWDANEKKVTVTLGSTTIELWIGKSIAKVNGVDTPIDSTNPKVVPEIINSRTMLPLRFVTENLGCDVQWEQSTQTITITYPKA
jgi:hypothetical protein